MGAHLREGPEERAFRRPKARGRPTHPARSFTTAVFRGWASGKDVLHRTPLASRLKGSSGKNLTPLSGGLLSSHAGTVFSCSPQRRPRHRKVVVAKRQLSNTPTSPCNLYIGDNFSVKLGPMFKLNTLIEHEDKNGLMVTQFDPFRPLDRMNLTPAAQKIKNLPNAGGNSVVSEVLSFEMMQRCFGAKLLKTEMEVTYWPEGGSITDYTCCMFGNELGVSVTRAMKYCGGDFTEEDAQRLLCKKLKGIVQSSRNTLDKWAKQILHVWAISATVATVVAQTYDNIPEDVKSNTVVLITVASSANEIFANK